MSEHQTYPELMALAQVIAEELNAIDDHTWTAVNGYTHLAYIQAADGRASLCEAWATVFRSATGWR
jgi:hypothetical protein